MASNQDTFDLATDLSEVALDRIVDHEILNEIPVIGSIVKIARISHSISDRLFLAKVGTFLEGLEEISTDDREKILSKVSPLGKHAKEISEQLVFALEKIDTLVKCRVITALFRALVSDKIDRKIYMKLVFSVVNSYWDELRQFLLSTETEFVVEFDTLVANGLIYAEGTFGNLGSRGNIKFTPTSEGEKLREICRPFLAAS